jgi:two-component system alkaline phosphatase synthesis response regulator PhoP
MENQARRILLAEDDRFLRKAAGAMLRRQGFTVLTAEDGEEALRVARAETPDLILLDLIMPKMQGFEVLKALKSDPQTSPIPVVILSNLGQESDSKAAREMGALDYWVKANLALGELVSRVEETLTVGTSGEKPAAER